MKSFSFSVMLILITSISLSAQPHQSDNINVIRNVHYHSSSEKLLSLDLYIPVAASLASGIGISSEENKTASLDDKKNLLPLIIWIPEKPEISFPTPVAAYAGNGYVVASIQYESNTDLIANIKSAVQFIHKGAEKYHIDTTKTGIIQSTNNDYIAAIWQGLDQNLKTIAELKSQIRLDVKNDDNFSKLQSSENTNLIIGFFDKNLKNGAHKESNPLKISVPPDSWIDPITNTIPGTSYQLFPTSVRGENTFGSYLIYLPEDYSKSNKRFPVIYWLHGGNGTQREGSWMCEQMIWAMKKKEMPQTIVVFVQGLPIGWYNNSIDGKMPVEDVIIENLVPHIDSTYRTIAKREARALEGMSMGGYGALHLGFKYPELFGVVSAIAPSITTFEMERKEVIYPTFQNDSAYFNANSPVTLLAKNSAYLKQNTKIRLLVGDKDFLIDLVRSFHQQLMQLEIEHVYSEAVGAEHEYEAVIKKLGYNPFLFWNDTFKSIISR